MKTTTKMALIGALALGATSGCAMQQEQNLNALQDPKRINCATADGDLRILQSEKANVGQRIAEGATAIYPAGLVVGLLTGTEGTKLKVATGDYDAQIDQRIAEIQETCGIR
jgi:hypothetical protein